MIWPTFSFCPNAGIIVLKPCKEVNTWFLFFAAATDVGLFGWVVVVDQGRVRLCMIVFLSLLQCWHGRFATTFQVNYRAKSRRRKRISRWATYVTLVLLFLPRQSDACVSCRARRAHQAATQPERSVQLGYSGKVGIALGQENDVLNKSQCIAWYHLGWSSSFIHVRIYQGHCDDQLIRPR